MFLFLKGPHPIFLIFFFNKNNPHPYTKNTGEEKRIFYEFVCCLILRIMLVSQSVPILLPPPPPPQTLWLYWWRYWWHCACDMVWVVMVRWWVGSELCRPVTGFVVFCSQIVLTNHWLCCVLLPKCVTELVVASLSSALNMFLTNLQIWLCFIPVMCDFVVVGYPNSVVFL